MSDFFKSHVFAVRELVLAANLSRVIGPGLDLDPAESHQARAVSELWRSQDRELRCKNTPHDVDKSLTAMTQGNKYY
jgi:hypothetical protein